MSTGDPSDPSAIDPRLARMLEDLQPQIEKQVKDAAAKAIVDSLHWRVKSAVEMATVNYIEQRIVPDVTKAMEENHAEIVRAAVGAIHVGADALRDAMIAALTKKLTETYRVERLIRELLG